MVSTKVQPYAEYTMSKIAGDDMDYATKIFAAMITETPRIMEDVVRKILTG